MNNIELKQLQINNRNHNSNVRLSEVVQSSPSYTQIDLSHSHFTSFNSGVLVPIYWEEVLPADIFSIKLSGIIRMSTPATNTMSNPIISVNFFYVSCSSITDSWKYFFGETKQGGFVENINISYNYDFSTNTQTLKYSENDLMSYLGFPINKILPKSDSLNSIVDLTYLPCLCYGKIVNEWYLDQNLDSIIDIEIPSGYKINFSAYQTSFDYHKSIKYGFGLAPVSKLPDYFSTCLPFQQKGIALPVGRQDITNIVVDNLTKCTTIPANNKNSFNPNWLDENGMLIKSSDSTYDSITIDSFGVTKTTTGSSGYGEKQANLQLGIRYREDVPPASGYFNVNDLRNVITLQHYFELDARFGTRYNEYLFSHWGINVDPLDVNKSLLIGGWEDSLQISTVAQTSSSTASAPLGSLGGILQNYFECPNRFEYASTQHGYIFGMLCVRSPIYYSQGIPRKLMKRNKFSYFDPLFNNISDQPVYNYEIYYDDADPSYVNSKIFGYNEAWSEYRYTLNRASGFLSSNSNQSLRSLYLYGENYSTTPSLNINWMKYNPNIIDNTLFKVESSTTEFYNQFIANFNFDVRVDRKIALYGKPGVDKI